MSNTSWEATSEAIFSSEGETEQKWSIVREHDYVYDRENFAQIMCTLCHLLHLHHSYEISLLHPSLHTRLPYRWEGRRMSEESRGCYAQAPHLTRPAEGDMDVVSPSCTQGPWTPSFRAAHRAMAVVSLALHIGSMALSCNQQRGNPETINGGGTRRHAGTFRRQGTGGAQSTSRLTWIGGWGGRAIGEAMFIFF